MNARVPSAVTLSLVLVVTGCFAPPRVEDDPRVELPGVIEEAEYGEYWLRHDVPFLLDRPERYKRVVVSEFTVEFVTVRQVKGIPGGAARVDLLQFTPVGAGMALLGVGRRIAEFDEDFMRDLPAELFGSFRAMLEDHDLTVVDPNDVVASRAYADYKTVMKDPSGGSYFTPVGSDTGRIRATQAYPLRGLGIIAGSFVGDVEDVDSNLLADLEADLVIRARFRVGVYDGRASVEKGSIVTVTGRDVLGYLESSRSLLSKQSVLKNEGYQPIRGNVYEVSSRRYALAIKRLFPRYLELAIPPGYR